MKATVNNSASYVINNDMLNEKKCLKYVSKPTMVEEIMNIQKAIFTLSSNFTARIYNEKNSKQELFEAYSRLVIIYKEFLAKREAEIAANVQKFIKPAGVIAEEAQKEAAERAAAKAQKEAKKAKKAEKVVAPEGTSEKSAKEAKEVRQASAQERLNKYTAELKEKEAIAEPSKEVKHRIASLKRKIARAERAMGNAKSVTE